MRPVGILAVRPVNVATFHATKWDGSSGDISQITWMAEQFGWKIVGVNALGNLVIIGRNRKRYLAGPGEWIVALGANGSLRVCTDRQFQKDYREVSE